MPRKPRASVDRRQKTLIATLAAQIASGSVSERTTRGGEQRDQLAEEAVDMVIRIFNRVEAL